MRLFIAGSPPKLFKISLEESCRVSPSPVRTGCSLTRSINLPLISSKLLKSDWFRKASDKLYFNPLWFFQYRCVELCNNIIILTAFFQVLNSAVPRSTLLIASINMDKVTTAESLKKSS